MLDNPTASVPAHKVSDYELSDYRVSVGLLGVRLSSIHCNLLFVNNWNFVTRYEYECFLRLHLW